MDTSWVDFEKIMADFKVDFVSKNCQSRKGIILIFLWLLFSWACQELRKQCQKFATALLDHTRSSYELEVMLNHDPNGPPYQHGDRMNLNRLKLAIKYRQKDVRSCTPRFQPISFLITHLLYYLWFIPLLILVVHYVWQLIIFFFFFWSGFSLWRILMCSSYWRPFGTKDCPDSGVRTCSYRLWKWSASAYSSRSCPSCTLLPRTREPERLYESLSSNSFATLLPTSSFSVKRKTISLSLLLQVFCIII